MGKNKITRDTAHRFNMAIDALVTDLTNKTEDMQSRYSALNESFRDPVYHEYKSEFVACDKSIKEACELLREIGAAVVRYADSVLDTY